MKAAKILIAIPAATLSLGAFSISSEASDDVYNLVFSTYLPPSYEYIYVPAENFVNKIQERSEGRLKVDLFHSAQLFEGHDELSALSRGDIDITNMTGTYPSASVPSIGVFALPFMFDDIDHLSRALEAGLLESGLNEEMKENHDTIILGVAPLDPYEFYSRQHPILEKEDFGGKVWATTGSTDAQAIQLLGGSPTGMASSELYLAFDRGVVDATPRPLITGLGRSLDEVIEYISLATFLVDTSILAMNRDAWERLPEDLQEIILEAAKERDAEQFAMVEDFITEALAYYEENGVTIHEMSADAVADLRNLTAPVIEEWANNVANGERYLEIIEATREGGVEAQ
ncbi:TRAP transporter substrate-binding protein [Billgrantia desiderata]|uniref:TRAP transporter substrate-binding protein n=1 Tax=Billgrantia desiderata TaxID=52021 RepID=UPI003F4134CD